MQNSLVTFLMYDFSLSFLPFLRNSWLLSPAGKEGSYLDCIQLFAARDLVRFVGYSHDAVCPFPNALALDPAVLVAERRLGRIALHVVGHQRRSRAFGRIPGLAVWLAAGLEVREDKRGLPLRLVVSEELEQIRVGFARRGGGGWIADGLFFGNADGAECGLCQGRRRQLELVVALVHVEDALPLPGRLLVLVGME